MLHFRHVRQAAPLRRNRAEHREATPAGQGGAFAGPKAGIRRVAQTRVDSRQITIIRYARAAQKTGIIRSRAFLPVAIALTPLDAKQI